MMQITDFFYPLDSKASLTKGYNALCDDVGIRELSQISFLKLMGKDSLSFLHRITTNHLENLAPWSFKKTIFANEKGRIVDVVSVLNFQEYLFLAANQPCTALTKWIQKFIVLEDIELTNLHNQYFIWEILGPKADIWISQNFKDTQKLSKEHFLVVSQNGVEFILLRDFERWWLIGEQRDACLQMLAKTSANIALVLEEAHEVYRVEKGVGKVPNEINEKINPHEAGLIDLVSFTKGCYIGQEVIARLDSYDKVQKHLHGIIFSSKINFAPGLTLINKDKKEVGEVTSIVYSSKLQKHIGLAYIRKKFVAEASFQIVGQDVSAQVVELPFT